VNADQEVRASAAQAAARLMAPIQPSSQDFIFVADLIAQYISSGRDAALAQCAPQPLPAEPEPVTVHAAEVPVTEKVATSGEAEVFQFADGNKVSPKQETARRILENTRRTRVASILKQATVAKAQAHRQKLVDEAEEAGLNDYAITHPTSGEAMTLGAYLATL
jgi:hypothetical protein